MLRAAWYASGHGPTATALPQLEPLRSRPPLEQIAAAAAAHFGQDAATWTPGSRCDDLGRAVAAYVARRCFGYSARPVAQPLGYRSHGGVCGALVRVEVGGDSLKRTVAQLAANLD